MITRGYYIGEIIDSLATISQQVDTRCKLGLTDLNKYLEEFYLTILNKSLNFNLKNANEKRSNEPGLDLIDISNDIGFQITSQRSSQKINGTLKIVSELSSHPKKIIILIIRNKQDSYTLDNDLCNLLNFSIDDIWDINTLCKKLIELPIDSLQFIYDYIRKELVRVKIDLEIPNEDGEYPTSIRNIIEQEPVAIFNDLLMFYKYLNDIAAPEVITLDSVKEDLNILSSELAKLPRITREFYAYLLEKRDQADVGGEYYRFNYYRLKRLYKSSSLDEELTLLSEHGFIDRAEPDNEFESPYIRIYAKAKSDYFVVPLVDFMGKYQVDFTDPIVKLDFSKF